MQKIVPHLWFDTQAKEAAEFYATVFPDTRVTSVTTLPGTPSGDAQIVSFTIGEFAFMAISAGPYFTINPSISFMLNYDPSRDPQAREHLDAAWEQLSAGGTALMPVGEYPFSKRYGWIQDKFGVSWQLILTNPAGEPRPFIIPALLFTNERSGKAEEATEFYLKTFRNAKRGTVARYDADTQMGQKKGDLMFTDVQLEGQWFAAMDGGTVHAFGFGEGVSLIIKCADQAEIDHYWEKLSAVPAAEQCGWLKDAYGVSWQVAPAAMDRMMTEGTPEQIARVTQAFLPMKKFDIAALERAYKGE